MNLNYVTIYAHFRFVREKKIFTTKCFITISKKKKNKDKENDSNKIVEINKIFQMSY